MNSTCDVESAVFRLACQQALSDGDPSFVNVERLFARITPLGLSRADFSEALDSLEAGGFVRTTAPIGRRLPPSILGISRGGFEAYLVHEYPSYAALVGAVACEIRDGKTTTKAIAEALSQPQIVIIHIVNTFADRGWLDTHSLGSHGLVFADPKPQLKRLCQRASVGDPDRSP
jgi:hypothetical protein